MCACSLGRKLLPDGKTCTTDKNYTVSSSCGSEYFKCNVTGAKVCVPIEDVCDGSSDCPDDSDESSAAGGPCENIECNENQHKCDNNRCIAKYWLCDGEKDCLDGSDENSEFCTGNCTDQQFACENSKRCIHKAWKCDGVVDCGLYDNSDEKDCCE